LSDVTGDPLDVIASGPTVPDPTTFKQAKEIIAKYDLAASIPERIISFINEGTEGFIPETPKPDDTVFDKTYNFLIGNNKIALEAARGKAIELGINAEIITDRIEGDAVAVSEYIVGTALKYQSDVNVPKPVSLLFGGEPTVKVTGNGTGGRNQHLALVCSALLRRHKGITMLSAGTDGNDGPTSAAGAVVDCDTYDAAVSQGIIPEEYLLNFDSFDFFRKAGGHIITGPTMTNVMDIMVVIVE